MDRELIAKICYQYAYLIDDKKIDSLWANLSERQSARFYNCADTILSYCLAGLKVLSDKEILAAFDGDFKVDFDHKPTMEDIFLIKLRLVAKAQRDAGKGKGGDNES